MAERRDDLAQERIHILNRLHGLLRDLTPGGVPVGLSADKAAALLRTTRPPTATTAWRRDLARDLRADLHRASTVNSGLVSDITITRGPVLIGNGLPLFGSLDAGIGLNTPLDSRAGRRLHTVPIQGGR